VTARSVSPSAPAEEAGAEGVAAPAEGATVDVERTTAPAEGAMVDAGGATADAGATWARARTPDFFIVGHPKSGTTALYETLKRHPQIYMCEEKEPWFFSPELRFRPPPRKPFAIPDTFEDYLELFAAARPEQRVGEASTTYLWSHAAAGLIAQAQPDARIVAILREPVSFLYSLHLQFLESYIETESDFRRALALEPYRRAGRHIARHSYWPQLLQYAEHVRYVEQLRRYHDVFPDEQILVLIYDDFRADNETAVRGVLRFLGVDDQAPIELAEANSTVRARSHHLHQLVHAVSVGRGPVSRGVKAGIQALTPRRMRRGALHLIRDRVVYGEARPLEEDLMLELRRRFEPQVAALSEYLDRDLLSLWGYGDVG
jgi:hypothetical protein